MNNTISKSEIRDSLLRELVEKVRRQNYEQYLLSIRLERIRKFKGAQINFDFPVTALIGPNGSGKSTILNAAACLHSSSPAKIFYKSRIGDDSMEDWQIEYEVVDKNLNPKGTTRSTLVLAKNQWKKSTIIERHTKFFSISRTVPAPENPFFALRKKLSSRRTAKIKTRRITDIASIQKEAEKILGKSLEYFELYEVSSAIKRKPLSEAASRKNDIVTQLVFVGKDDEYTYSEFNFGAGESSVIRIVSEIEYVSASSLVLIEEIENGLHPVAVRRLTEYLIDVAKRKSLQVIFTTHSDYAIDLLPPEAIWACIDGRLEQGKLSVEALRAVSGRIDRKLAIFVEDDFSKSWVEAVLRESLMQGIDQIGIYAVSGDGNAVRIHMGHISNPSVSFHSLCFIDGDSHQQEKATNSIYRLPGQLPELTIFNSVITNLDKNIALLTVACQRPLEKQDQVRSAIRDISHTNRDPHLLFSQVGEKIGFIPEAVVRGAFLSIWIQENRSEANQIADYVIQALDLPPKK